MNLAVPKLNACCTEKASKRIQKGNDFFNSWQLDFVRKIGNKKGLVIADD